MNGSDEALKFLLFSASHCTIMISMFIKMINFFSTGADLFTLLIRFILNKYQ